MVMDNRQKIIKLLQNSSIKHLRRNLDKAKPDAIDTFMTEQEGKENIETSNWSSLAPKQKEFYSKLSDVNFLN